MSGRSLKFPNELKLHWAVNKDFRTARKYVGRCIKIFERLESAF